MIVLTLKLYLDNSYLKEIDGNIVEKSFQNNKYYIKLDRTIFYPHLAGGQPRDQGQINGIKVIDVYESDREIIHVVKEDIKEARVDMAIDWDHRYDHMQQHTGQHLLSSSITSLFNSRTVGFYLGQDYASIDIEKPSLDLDEVRQIEYLTNKIIQYNFSIKTYMEKQDTRIVEIVGLDSSPCCGTHLARTGEVGLVKIIRWGKHRGNTRIEFLCGNRALEDYTWKNQAVREIAKTMSAQDRDVVEKIKHLKKEKKKLKRENRKLREEVYQYRGESFLDSRTSYQGVDYIIKEITDLSLRELGQISSYLNQKEKLVQIYSIPGQEESRFLVSRSRDLDINLRNILNQISKDIDCKGGGSPLRVQGGAKNENINDLLIAFYRQIREYLKG